MDVVDLTDSPFGNEHETAAAAAVASRIETAAKETLLAGSHSAAEGGDTPSAEDGDANSSAASLRARTESLTARINQIDARMAQLSRERELLEGERSNVRAQLVRASARAPKRDWSGGPATFPEAAPSGKGTEWLLR